MSEYYLVVVVVVVDRRECVYIQATYTTRI